MQPTGSTLKNVSDKKLVMAGYINYRVHKNNIFNKDLKINQILVFSKKDFT